jgi:hypothetical protein
MPAWAKVLLAFGCGLVLLIAAIGVGGYLYVNRHKDEWFAAGKKARDEGQTFAAGRNGSDCVDESLRRVRECSGIACEVRVRAFLDGCLDAAAESPQLCEAVPPRGEIVRTVRWSLDECARRGLPNSQPCSRVLQDLQKYCQRKLHR